VSKSSEAKSDREKSSKTSFARRGFLKKAAAGAAVLAAAPQGTRAQQPAGGRGGRGGNASAQAPDGATLARENGAAQPARVSRIVEHPGSDFMVDLIRSLGIEYAACNPGSSFEGLHESIINYGNNTMPELITCCHEESAVAMAHGYGKIEGKPMLALLHGTIGVQHAAMAVYNAYADRTPIVMIAGNGDGVPPHNAIDPAVVVRDYVKWDHQPDTLAEFGRTLLRAYTLAMTPPMAPVLVVMSAKIQQAAMTQNMVVPKLVMPKPPSADIGSLREVAKMLVAAQNPKVNAGRLARTPNGITLLVELAELLQMPVNVGGDRVNFPSRHPLAGNGDGQPDLMLGLEPGGGFFPAGDGAPASAKRVNISSMEFLATHNFNVLGYAGSGDIVLGGDGEASLPDLIEEVRKLITPDMKRRFEERGKKHAAANRQARLDAVERAQLGWDASPIAMGRVCAELWPLIENEDWSLVSPQTFAGGWPNRLWNIEKHYHFIGEQGAGGMGYGAPASVGAALANKKYGRLSINLQTDGDLNYAPGVLWTAAHHKIPLLSIMHNNRGYHQEVMFIAQQASLRNRGQDRAHIGTRLIDPTIDYAMMARTYGMHGEGPITDPKDLAAVLKRSVERVKQGEPVLIDVVTQPRG
jgi:thiamine pyrophosphate-dependent acetolactate synthase large subunit-like protein